MKFKVISSTLSTRGGYVNRIEGQSVMSIFGVNKTTNHRYSIKSDAELKVGAEQELDLNEFTIDPVQQVQLSGSQFGRDTVTTQGVVRVSTAVWLHAKGV